MRPNGRVSLVLSIILLAVVPLVPRAVTDGSPAALLALPAESILVLFLIFLLPQPSARIAVAVVFGLVVVVAISLAGIDAGYRAVLDIPFDPLDWQQLGDAFGVVRGTVGGAVANALVALIAVAAVGLVGALAWAALRVSAAIRPLRPVRPVRLLGPDRARGTLALTAVAAVWLVAALTGSRLVAGYAVAADASVDAIAASASRAADGLAAVADLQRRIETDPYRDVPGGALLAGLAGKDVIFAFVESYGRVAVEDSDLSAGVERVLRDGDAQLRADGYASQSAFLTSPTFGGLSWLAHSTLQSGLWIDRQPVYSRVIRSDRLTLTEAFGRAGWRTVSVVPSNTEPWPFGTSFYHFDTLLDANNVGYHGPSFGYARIPDQYTWKHLADEVLGADDGRPVMAEVDLVSSHTPWAPLPELVPWSETGDGSVFGPQPAQGESAGEVWQDPERVRQAYARSIRYSLGAMFAFLHESDDPDLVLVVLGDHQPATIVSGRGAGHDVPISIISKDPAVFAAIAEWSWEDGVLPSPDAPVWPMSDFRDRFLGAFGGRANQSSRRVVPVPEPGCGAAVRRAARAVRP
ncbi:CDP-alcohol phosphatidyltransferase [Agromyces sp. MMS24-JH15]|uniref:CDP-alcohol phosphatidyltransferase n=1 Tax=Agromyces sp. MMS24-JH15 TaxID=3243765 RepID=UPI00374831FA